jgi:single-stranded-DNA-specific exonuclease
MGLNKWEIREHGGFLSDAAVSEFKISPLLRKVLEARGITDRESVRKLLCSQSTDFHDPFLLKDMDKAVSRIKQAIANGERITVYGDYDVDGITSVYILSSCLKSKGADVHTYIPERESEGYGVNTEALRKIASGGTTLLITVDNGIAAADELKYASEAGMDVIVTDHHEPWPELPDCRAVIDPRRPDCPYPFKELAGVGVVFKLLCALEGGDCGLFEKYGDMVALGTIADVMSLTGENRLITDRGLKLIENTENPGLAALIKASCKGEINISSVGYRLLPRLNAAGRMSSAVQALALLESKTVEEAEVYAASLCELNRKRQECEARVFAEALQMIESGMEEISDTRVIVLYNTSWKLGVIGIVASRLAEKYGLPAVLMTLEDNMVKGSARSIEGYNIYSAIARAVEGLGSCGGHMMAAGVKLPPENIEKFKKALGAITRAEIKARAYPPLLIDCEISPEMACIEQVADLSRLEPYGAGNPQPLFCLKQVEIADIAAIGGGRHTRLLFEKAGTLLTAIYFGMEPKRLPYHTGDIIDAAFYLEVNVFRGLSSVRLNIRDLRPAFRTLERAEAAMHTYRDLIEPGNCVFGLKRPERAVFASVWRAVKSLCGGTTLCISPALLYKNLRSCGFAGDELAMIVSLRAFYESGLLAGLTFLEYDFYGEMRLELNPDAPQKVDLDKTGIISRLRA